MNEKLKKHLDGVFLPYGDIKAVKDLKEELSNDLQEKLNDLTGEGYDEDTAYKMTIDSIGDVSELIEGIRVRTGELQQTAGMDFSKSNLQYSDFKGISAHDGKFDFSDLRGSDFSGSDLSKCSLKCSNLENSNFDGANLTGAIISKSNLRGASFRDSILDGAVFVYSELAGVCFDNQTLNGTRFDYSGLKQTSFRNAVLRNASFKTNVKNTIFDGAIMDKPTYAVLKGFKAKLDQVTVI